MTWRETNTVRDFRTFRKGTYVITTFHTLHDGLHHVILEEEDKVAICRQMTREKILAQYGIEL